MSSIRKMIYRLRLFFLSSILISSVLVTVVYFPNDPENGAISPVEPYFGISFCGNTTAEAKLLIDRTKDYTNLFVLQSGPISKNETAINIICDYAVESGLDFIVFFGWFDTDYPWLDIAKERWGASFLGVYLYDEPDGIQIDGYWEFVFQYIKEVDPEFYQTIEDYIDEGSNQTVVRNYEETKVRYLNYIIGHLRLNELTNRSIAAFSSDYAMYWFDYIAGYDTIFVELGWHHDTQKHIALGRGAATVQQKDWETIIVWNDIDRTGNNTGDYKTGPEMLEDMLSSYEAGADYIIIFNYPTDPPGNSYGILTDEHFVAMQQFWNHMQRHPEEYGETEAQAALVLPQNYAWGMRSLDDKIWGYWGPDERSEQIWELSQDLLDQYGLALDIVYDDPNFPIAAIYQEIRYWNETR